MASSNSSSSRIYDVILFGATGYTGALCAEHITTHLPTSLRWAIAGRSESKLEKLRGELKALNFVRDPPAIEVCSLVPAELASLAQKTRVLIAAVGPYSIYGEGALAACAKNGTHYLDVTGESVWVLDMIRKYDSVAKEKGAIIIPQIGIESAPADLGSLALVQAIRNELHSPTQEVIFSCYDLNSTPSGGTYATVLSIAESYSLRQIAAAAKPWAHSPIPHQKTPKQSSAWHFFGTRSVPGLGLLGPWIASTTDRAIVQRSWGLLGGEYGSSFEFREYRKVKNYLSGVLMTFALGLGTLAIIIPPIRWLLKKLVYQPGMGRTKEQTAKEYFEWRGVAFPESKLKHQSTKQREDQQKAFVKIRWDGGAYYFTGVLLAHAAMSLLEDETEAKKMSGGLLTPATLGEPFIRRLVEVGLQFETAMI